MEIETRFQDIEKLKFLVLADNTKFEEFSSNIPIAALDSLMESDPINNHKH